VSRWRLLLTPPLDAAENMAIDEALLGRARRTGETVFRVYAWSCPTLSLGRNQTACGVYDAAAARDRGVSIVRRLTGGRAVLHHREVTYSVTAPLEASESLGESYGRINRLLLSGLQSLGVRATVARPRSRVRSPGFAPCFEEPAPGELVVDHRKLVGSAQVREQNALLQHGSILVDDDQGMIAALATRALPDLPAASTLRDALQRVPTLEEVAEALFGAVRQIEDPAASPLIDDMLDADVRDARRRYDDDSWTWRR
jgi:lipoyl(octanoyl) transferase